MPRTRSRPRTEQNFQEAVLRLIAEQGCGGLGINAVAQLAGADKVLIYRYFGDFDGLLERVATSRSWLPSAEEVMETSQARSALDYVRHIERRLIQHIRDDATVYQLLRWRRTEACSVCREFTREWRALWKQLTTRLSSGMESEQRRLWAQTCEWLPLMIEAELCGEPVDRHCLERIVEGLETPLTEDSDDSAKEDTLPTNLL